MARSKIILSLFDEEFGHFTFEDSRTSANMYRNVNDIFAFLHQSVAIENDFILLLSDEYNKMFTLELDKTQYGSDDLIRNELDYNRMWSNLEPLFRKAKVSLCLEQLYLFFLLLAFTVI